jgi:predicted dehydrogenase
MKNKKSISRRSFVANVGTGILSAFALSSLSMAELVSAKSQVNSKKIRIGIIGAENTHTVAYGRLFNIGKRFPGVEVLYVWGETDAFAKNAMDKGRIPYVVKDPKEMMGKIDALIVDHRSGRYHLQAAKPFVEAGIPTFVDKPFCYRASEGKKFLEMARKHGTPVSSYSMFAQSKEIADIKKQVSEIEEINQVVMYGPVDVESKYDGIFYYGIHITQQMLNIFGDDIEKVRISRNGKNANATVAYRNGMIITLIFSHHHSGWGMWIETETGYHKMKSYVWDDDPEKGYQDMVEMFRSGKEPRSYQDMLNSVSLLEALERSVGNEQWEDVHYLKID